MRPGTKQSVKTRTRWLRFSLDRVLDWLGSGNSRTRPFRPSLEALEVRALPVVTFAQVGGSINFSSDTDTDDLYLKTVNGVLEFNTDGSNQYTSTHLALSATTTVDYTTLECERTCPTHGTLYLVAMDSGGGKFTTKGPVLVVGDVTTHGQSLSLDGTTITVGEAVLGSSGTLNGQPGQSLEIKSSDSNSRIITAAASASFPPLTAGQTVAFTGVSGTGPYSLQNGQSYEVEVIDQSDLDRVQLRLYKPRLPTQPLTVSTSSSTGPAGKIDLTAPSIVIGPSTKLLAKGSSVAADGAITLTATDTIDNQGTPSLIQQLLFAIRHGFSADISIGDKALLDGGNVTLEATSGDLSIFADSPGWFQKVATPVGSLINSYLSQWLSLPVSVLFNKSTSTIAVGENAKISSTGSVKIDTEATANSTGEASYWAKGLGGVLGASFAYSKATAEARSLVGANATILAQGDVSIESQTTTTTSGTAQVAQNTGLLKENPNNVQLSGAYNKLNTVAHAIVSQGAAITTPGSVTVLATATDSNSINVLTNSFRDGKVGITGALADVDADVKALVEGTITAGLGSLGGQKTFNPFLSGAVTVDFANSRFVFKTNPGYKTGDRITYSSGLGGAVPGLENRKTYYAVVSAEGDKHFLRLAATEAEARRTAPNTIEFGQYPTLGGIPITRLDPKATNHILYDFDPGFTQGESVAFLAGTGQFLGYKDASGSLAGPLSGNYTIDIVNGAHPYAIQLKDSAGNVVQLDDSPYLELTTTSGKKSLRIQGSQLTSNQVALLPSDLPIGFTLKNADALTYHAGLGTNVPGLVEGVTYYAIVDPALLHPSDSTVSPTIQLAATITDAQAANPVKSPSTFAWTDSSGAARTTTILHAQAATADLLFDDDHLFKLLASDPATKVLTLSRLPGSTTAPLLEGQLLTYEGSEGNGGTLNNGGRYVVKQILAQDNPAAIQLVLQDSVSLPTLGTLTQNGTPSQTFAIGFFDAGSKVLTVARTGVGSFTALKNGDTFLYAGASISGFLENGQSYIADILQQTSEAHIQLRLSPNNLVTPPGTLLDSRGHTFTITSSNPVSSVLILAEPSGATPTAGDTLTYSGPSVSTYGYLQSGQKYLVSIPDPSKPAQVHLVAAAYQVPTFENGLLSATGKSFGIYKSDANTRVVTVILEADSQVTTLTEGETLVFRGVTGTAADTLVDGQSYVVHVLDQGQKNAITIQLRTLPLLAGYGTLTWNGGSYVIHQADAGTGTLTLNPIGLAGALTDGTALTFSGTSASGSGFLQNGQSYTVHDVNQDDPKNIRVRLSNYLVPTFGRVANGGHSFTIRGFDGPTQVVTLSLDDGSAVPLLAARETLTYTGSVIPSRGLLQNGKPYTVQVLDQSNPRLIRVRLLDPSGPALAAPNNDGIDPLSNAVIVDSAKPLIPNGTIVTFHKGGPGTGIGGLQDGVNYRAEVDANHPTLVHLLPQGSTGGPQVRLTSDETLRTASGNSYTIVASDGLQHVITVIGATAATPSLTDGEAVVYAAALGASTASLIDGTTYYVRIPVPAIPTVIQLLPSPGGTPLNFVGAVDLKKADTSYMSGSAHTLNLESSPGILISAKLTSSESVSVWSGIGGEPKLRNKGLPELLRAGYRNVFPDDEPAPTDQTAGDRQDGETLNTNPGGGNEALAHPFALTASFMVQRINNSVVAVVGPTANLSSQGGITVSAKIEEDNQAYAGAATSVAKNKNTTEERPQVGLAISVLVGLLHNSAHAIVDGGSQVDAAGALNVAAEILYPWVGQIKNPNGFDPATMFGTQLANNVYSLLDSTLGIQTNLVNNFATAAASAKGNSKDIAVAGSVQWTEYTNDSQARIDAGALVNQRFPSAEQTVRVAASTTFETVNFTGNTNFDILPMDIRKAYKEDGMTEVANVVLPPNQGKVAAIGASLSGMVLRNNTRAIVGGADSFDPAAAVDSKAHAIDLGEDRGYRTGQQLIYGSRGGAPLQGLADGLTYFAIVDPTRPNRLQLAASLEDANASKAIAVSAVGATGAAHALRVPGATKVNFGRDNASGKGFDVLADQKIVIVNIGTSGGLDSSGLGAGGSYGLNGTFAYLGANTTTIAQVAEGTVATSTAGTTGATNVDAHDNFILIAVAGSAFKAKKAGIGLSGIANVVTRSTYAIIGADAAVGPIPIGPSSWTVGGPVNVKATEDGIVVNFALAGAVVSGGGEGDPPGGTGGAAANPATIPDPVHQPAGLGGFDEVERVVPEAAVDLPAQSSFGLQVSGDASFTRLTDNTKAYINDAGQFTTGALSIRAHDETILVGLGGSYAIASLDKQLDAEGNEIDPKDVTNIGIAGSYSQIELKGATQAFVQGARVTVTGDLTVAAERENYLGTLTFAAAGSSIKSSWEVAGSVALAFFSGDTKAFLKQVSGTVTGELFVTAQDKTIFVAIGGAVGIGGKGGLGVSIGYISIEHDLAAHVEQTTLSQAVNVTIKATALTALGSLGVALGVGKGKAKFAGAGNVSVNKIEMALDAHVSGNSHLVSPGTVTVAAEDKTYLVSVSGGLAITPNGKAAVGAAVSYNLISNTIQASIQDSSVQADGGSLFVSADSSPLLIALAAGGAGAQKLAIGGSVTINSIANTVTATIARSTVSASGDIHVTASESATEIVIAGAIGIAGSAAFGIAIAYNYMGQAFDTANPQVTAHGTSTSSTAATIVGSIVAAGGSLLVSAGYQPKNPLPTPTEVKLDGKTGYGASLAIPVSINAQVVAVGIGGAIAGKSGTGGGDAGGDDARGDDAGGDEDAAEDNSSLIAVGGAISLSYIRQTITAAINDSPNVTATGAVTVSALDSSSIGNGDLGFGFAKGTAAVGAAVGYNDVSNNLTATIDNSTVSSVTNNITVVSQETASIKAIAVGASGAEKYSLGGSIVLNTIDYDVVANIRGASNISATKGTVTVSASDSSEILGVAGSLTADISRNGGVTAAFGVGVAINTIGSGDNPGETIATISASTIQAQTLEVLATDSADIQAVSVAGAGALSTGGDGTNVGIAGAGAGSSNKVVRTTEARIINGATVQRNSTAPANGSAVRLSALDTSTVKAIAGGIALAGAFGGSSGVAVTVGAAMAVNDITTDTFAFIAESTVSSAGNVELTAANQASIVAAAVGVAGSIAAKQATGGLTLTVAAAGSGALNHVRGDTEASIQNEGMNPSTVASDGDVTLAALEQVSILSVAGTLAFSVALGKTGIAPAIAVSGSVNELSSEVEASIRHSTVNAKGSVKLTATTKDPSNNEDSIEAITVAGGVGVAVGKTSGAFAGAGAFSLNTIKHIVTASITNSSAVSADKDVIVTALNDASITADGGGATVSVAVGTKAGAPAFGLGYAENKFTDSSTTATIDSSSVSAKGKVVVEATSTSEIDAKGFGVAVSTAVGASGAVAAAGSGAVALNTIATFVAATIKDGSTVTASATTDDAVSVLAKDRITIHSSTGSGSLGISVGEVSVALAVGISKTINTVTNQVTAGIGFVEGASQKTTVTASNGGVKVSATSIQDVTAASTAVAATIAVPTNPEAPISVAIAGTGAISTNDVTPTVTAAITGGVTVTAGKGVGVTATNAPGLDSNGLGVAVSLGVVSIAIAGTFSTSTVNATVAAFVGDSTIIKAFSLSIQAIQDHIPLDNPTDKAKPTASTSSTAGSGAILAGADATTSTSSISGTVKAYTGSAVSLPDGDVTISATSRTWQDATGTGVAVGILAVGVVTGSASSDVKTEATLGAQPITSAQRPGALVVAANGVDRNSVSMVAGSGGVIAGNGASASTSDKSSAKAQVADATSTDGQTIHAGHVVVSAQHTSDYSLGADSINAALAAGNAALSTNTSATGATASVGKNTTIDAQGFVTVSSQNQFFESTAGLSAHGFAAGGIAGSGAVSKSAISGPSKVILGDGVSIMSGTNPFTKPGGIDLVASTVLQASDRVQGTAIGAVEGGGTNSEIIATLKNSVDVGSNGKLTSWGNIGAGTWTRADASTNTQANGGGFAGGIAANAKTRVDSDQSVTIGATTPLTAFGDITLTVGDDPSGQNSTIINSTAEADAFAYGLFVGPDYTPTSIVSSSMTLTVGTGSTLQSGLNVNVGTFPGSVSGRQIGESKWNGAGRSSNHAVTPTHTDSITLNSDITAGVYHKVDISIPGSAKAYDLSVSGPNALPFTPAIVSMPTFDAETYVEAHFDKNTELLKSAVSSKQVPVPAFAIGSLYASGGIIAISAAKDTTPNLVGKLTSYGGPRITITNTGPAYILLGSILIPDVPGGQVLLKGVPQANGGLGGLVYLKDADDNTLAAGGEKPEVTIDLTYKATVGDSNYGPALIVTAPLDNLGGRIAITNEGGSFLQASTIFGAQVNIDAPLGATIIQVAPPGVYTAGGNPYSEWEDYMIWPGDSLKNPTALFSAETAVVYAANAIYNPNNTLTPDALNKLVYKTAGDPAVGPSTVFLGNSQPFIDNVDDSLATNANLSLRVKANSTDFIYPANTNYTYQISPGNNGNGNQGYLPLIPTAPTSKTATSYNAANIAGSTQSSAIYSSNVGITAQTLDIDGAITIGKATNYSVKLSKALAADLRAYQLQYQGKKVLSPTYDIPTATGKFSTIVDADFLIGATYDARSDSITLRKISSFQGGGQVVLNGAIISTNNLGKIQFNPDSGTVSIVNETGIPLILQEIDAGDSAFQSIIDITDTNQPAATAHTRFVYEGGQTKIYVGPAGGTFAKDANPASTAQGNTTQYNPVAGMRWQWQERAIVERGEGSAPPNFSLTDWTWKYPPGSSANNPWQSVRPPLGDSLVDRSSNDAAVGQVYLSSQTFSGQDQPAAFSYYASITGGYLTPLVFSVQGGKYKIAAVYQSIAVQSVGLNTVPLVLQKGALDPTLSYVFGFATQQVQSNDTDTLNTIRGSTNAIAFDTDSDLAPDWLFTVLQVNVTLGLGTSFSANHGSAQVDLYTGRVYSASLTFANREYGRIVVDANETSVFKELITATVDKVDARGVNYAGDLTYLGFVKHNPLTYAADGSEARPWEYDYPLHITLTLTNSVKADNAIGILFTNGTPGSINITSDAAVYVSKPIQTNGPATIMVSSDKTGQGSLTQGKLGKVTSDGLTLRTNGPIGSPSQPLEVSLLGMGKLTANADSKEDVHINIDTGAVLGSIVVGNGQDGHGDLLLQAAGPIETTPDQVWMDDSLPTSASLVGGGTWVSSNPAPYSGQLALQSLLGPGFHQDYFQGANPSLSVGAGDSLFAYVYLDPVNPPQEVMLQWFANGSWEHRAYWGVLETQFKQLGIAGTESRRFMGALPAIGQWVRLTVPASRVGLDGATVSGMALSLIGGRATWDQSGVGTSIIGQNLTLSSSTDHVGTALAPLNLEAHSVPAANGGVREGIVQVDAPGDINLNHGFGSLLVSHILSTNGGVSLEVGGSLKDARTSTSPGRTLAHAKQVYQDLGLTDPSQLQAAVKAFETQVDANYQHYWHLALYGSVQNGVFVLTAAGEDQFRQQAAAALKVANPTSGQVQAYANQRYQQITSFFDTNLGSNWRGLPDFQKFNAKYDYTATADQTASLTQNSTWTEERLMFTLNQNALAAASDASLRATAPIIRGQTVSVKTGASAGTVHTAPNIALSSIESGILTDDEKAALTAAHLPGDAQLLTGTSNVQIRATRPVFLTLSGSAAAALNISAPEGVHVVHTGGDLNIGHVTSETGPIDLIMADPATSVRITGFGGNGAGWTVNSSSITSTPITNDVLTLTDGGRGQARSAWFNTPVGLGGFTAHFTYTNVSGPGSADGAAFVLQGDKGGTGAIGGGGSAVGVGGITPSLAYQIDIWQEVVTLTASNNTIFPSANTGSVSFSSGHSIDVTVTYDPDAQTLTVLAADKSIADAISRSVYPGVKLAQIFGDAKVYVGFTGGDGDLVSTQTISNFKFVSPTPRNLNILQVSSETGAVHLTTEGSILPQVSQSGFGVNGSGWTLNANQAGGSTIANDVLTITNNGVFAIGSAWSNTPVDTSSFHVSFRYDQSPITSGGPGGIAFVLQNSRGGTAMLDWADTVTGYGGSTAWSASAAYQINLEPAYTLGTSFYTFGPSGEPTTDPRSYSSTAPVDLTTGHPLQVQLTYNAITGILTEVLTDLTTNQTYTRTHTGIDLAATLGGPRAFLGFTGYNNTGQSTQTISNFTFTPARSTNVTGQNITMTAGGSIGTASASLLIDLTDPTQPGLDASAQSGVFVTETQGDLHIDQVSAANGPVSLAVAGGLHKAAPIKGFGGTGQGWMVNSSNMPKGSTPIANNVLTLTTAPPGSTDGFGSGPSFEFLSAWNSAAVPTGSFRAQFTYYASGGTSGVGGAGNDGQGGAVFVLQNDTRGESALGTDLGYVGLSPSVGYQISIHSTGLAGQIVGTNLFSKGLSGNWNPVGSVNLASGHPIQVELDYNADQGSFTETLTDATTGDGYTNTFRNINLANLVGGPTAILGFTGSDNTGVIQTISNFSFTPLGAGQGIILNSTSKILAPQGSVTFQAEGGQVVLPAGSVVTAQSTITIDPVTDTEYMLAGALNAQKVLVVGGGGNDKATVYQAGLNADLHFEGREGHDILILHGTDGPNQVLIDGGTIRLNGSRTITSSSLQDLQFHGGASTTFFGVRSTLPGTQTTLVGSAEFNRFWIGSDGSIANGSLDNIRGAIRVSGGSGQDELHIDDRGAKDGAGQALPTGYLVTPTQVIHHAAPRLPPRSTFAGLTYDGAIERLHLYGSPGANGSIHVKPSPNTAIDINAGSGTGGSLQLDITGSPGSLQSVAPGVGTWSFESRHQQLSFRGLEAFNTLTLGAAANANPVKAATTAEETFTIHYRGMTAIDLKEIQADSGAIRVSGPRGYSQPARLVGLVPSPDGSSHTASYTLRSPAGGWRPAFNGLYAIELAPGRIHDSLGRELPAGALGSFSVDISPHEYFVGRLYVDLLHRQAEPLGLAWWPAILAQGGSPEQVVLGIQATAEYRGNLIEGLYASLLGRASDAGGRDFFQRFLASGLTIEQAKLVFFGSPEYFDVRGGGNNAGFLTALYHDSLGRAADRHGESIFGLALAQGVSREEVARVVLNSDEAERVLIENWYRVYLHREADADGLAYWRALRRDGWRDEAIVAAIAASDEYFSGASSGGLLDAI